MVQIMKNFLVVVMRIILVGLKKGFNIGRKLHKGNMMQAS